MRAYYIFVGLLTVLTILLAIDYHNRAILTRDIFELFKAILFCLSGYIFGKNNYF